MKQLAHIIFDKVFSMTVDLSANMIVAFYLVIIRLNTIKNINTNTLIHYTYNIVEHASLTSMIEKEIYDMNTWL